PLSRPLAPLILALVGQTASGKNRAAVEAVTSANLPVEIISMDSMKLYRGMDVGTAKPDAGLRARVPHHLVDVADPHEYFDVARWFAQATEAESAIRARGNVPAYVGGTGMYLHLLVHGHFDGPGADAALRDALRAEIADVGLAALHARLAEVDPAAAARIHPNDEKRIIRALEVHALTGTPISQQQTQAQAPRTDVRFSLCGLRWATPVLDARIDRRCAEMFAAGWIDEVRRIASGAGFGQQAREALGYREILEHLAAPGRSEAETLALVQQRTRRFARKQMTWFRRFGEAIRWFDLDPATASAESVGAEVAAVWRSAIEAA
ncbi:MAG: tRNA (adenosine(37)-N6)-dimethylallyltransferase MiaA, partial [Planctomycetota bacterium]